MDSNTHANQPPESPKSPEVPGLPEVPEGLAGLVAVLDELATQDLDRLAGSVRAQRVGCLHQLAARLDGQWLKELAGLDALGAAGADQDQPAPSTASWLRTRLHLGAGAARSAVRTARALFRGALTQTAHTLTGGVPSPAHARVLAHGTQALPDHLTAEAEPVLLAAAARLDPPQLRQAVGYLVAVADPDRADQQAQRRHARRGLWLAPTFEGMVAVDGLLEAEAGSILLAALEPLARPADAHDARHGGQRTADALTELCRRSLEAGWLPRAGGVRAQLLVTVDLDSLLGHPDGVGGDLGWAGPLDPQACRRLACDSAVTRVLVSRQPNHADPDHGHGIDPGPVNGRDPGGDHDPDAPVRLPGRLRAALALLPPTLGGPLSRPLDVGRATRVVQPAQRAALAVRDRGCVFPGCQRPLAWCDTHHLWHWLDGGPTNLPNLALLCRAHHRTVHEGGWQLTRGPHGRLSATSGPPPHRSHHRHRPHPPAA